MKIKSILFLVALCTFSKAFCQEFEVPSPYLFKEKEDYAQYEKDIIAAAKWLEATPFNKQVEKRKEVSRFVFMWVNGSPTVMVEVNKTIGDFETKNPGMMVLYMAACARYVLENNDTTNVRVKHKAALHSMMTAYKAGGLEKDKNMDKLIKNEENGTLDKWMDANMKM